MRSSPVLLSVLLGALLLTLYVFSVAQSPASPSSPQQPGTTPAPSPSPQASPSPAQRGEDSSTAPSRPQAEAQSPNSQSSSNAQSDEENPLHLTDDQKAKLRPILIDESQQMEAVRNDTSLSQDQKIAKANAIREAASPKIKAVLTPEQLQRLADLQQKNRQNPPAQEQPPKK